MASKLIILPVLAAVVAVNLYFAEGLPASEDGASALGLLPKRVTCDYSKTPGSSCVSCRESLTCRPDNKGVIHTCRGLLRYCNYGRCSLFAEKKCEDSSEENNGSGEGNGGNNDGGSGGNNDGGSGGNNGGNNDGSSGGNNGGNNDGGSGGSNDGGSGGNTD
ncbi:uncharacterized protein [Epargyreus clarus]|uniref:uncharacterized protein n=1 Tax=Epargyreus clarus TaxID=520877 RepID=UPI003C2BDD45